MTIKAVQVQHREMESGHRPQAGLPGRNDSGFTEFKVNMYHNEGAQKGSGLKKITQ